jgi:hypothetical protein
MDFFDFSGRNRRDPASTSAASPGVPSNGGHATQAEEAEGHRADPLSSQQRMTTFGQDVDTWMSTQGDEELPPLAASRGSAPQSIK